MDKKALVFDDDPGVRTLFCRLLGSAGYSCEVFADPCEFACGNGHCDGKPCPGPACADLLLTDIRMLHVNGLDFVDRLERRCCQIPHIGIISGNWSEADRQRARATRCQTFEKPLGLKYLADWARSCTGRVA